MLTFTHRPPLPHLPIFAFGKKFRELPMFRHQLDLEALLLPETPQEAALLGTPTFREGLDWGTPRFGHPEGKVGLHVREVLDNVEREATGPADRQRLRLIALAHDTLKYREYQLGRRTKHHGLLAREFMEAHSADATALDIIELHDEAFYAWRGLHLEGRQQQAQRRLDALLGRMGDALPLYLAFFRCDTRTGDKIQAPLLWFERVAQETLASF